MELKPTKDLDTSWSNIVNEAEENGIDTFLKILLDNIETRNSNIESIERSLSTEKSMLEREQKAFRCAVQKYYKGDRLFVIDGRLIDLDTMEIKNVKVI